MTTSKLPAPIDNNEDADDKTPMTKELLQAIVATETRLSCIGRILKHFWADFRALADFI